MSNAIFVDLNGHTARVDPQSTSAHFVRLTVIAEQVYDEETGCLTHRGQSIEMYITADQADALADALRNGRKS